MMNVRKFALALATTACLFTLAIGSTTSAASVATTVAGGNSSITTATTPTTASPATATGAPTPSTTSAPAGGATAVPTAAPPTAAPTTAAPTAAPPTAAPTAAPPTAAPTAAAPTSTTPKPVCYNQTCTGDATCTNTSGATCDLDGKCFQKTISNSTHTQVQTGCSSTCEPFTSTAQTGFTEVNLCCDTDQCNRNLKPASGSSMTTASLLLAFTSVLFYALI